MGDMKVDIWCQSRGEGERSGHMWALGGTRGEDSSVHVQGSVRVQGKKEAEKSPLLELRNEVE
jgi:hypothetical protein